MNNQKKYINLILIEILFFLPKRKSFIRRWKREKTNNHMTHFIYPHDGPKNLLSKAIPTFRETPFSLPSCPMRPKSFLPLVSRIKNSLAIYRSGSCICQGDLRAAHAVTNVNRGQIWSFAYRTRTKRLPMVLFAVAFRYRKRFRIYTAAKWMMMMWCDFAEEILNGSRRHSLLQSYLESYEINIDRSGRLSA